MNCEIKIRIGIVIFIALLIMTSCTGTKKMTTINKTGIEKHIYIAHRGASYIAPENTRASINLAWKLAADAAEIDIRLTADNKIVVIHDASTLRTGDIDKKISESSYNEIKNIDVGKFKSNDYIGENIPLLDSLIGYIPIGKVLFIEIKSGPDILRTLKNIIEKSNVKERLVFIAFNYETLASAKLLMPEIPTFWLLSSVDSKNIKEIIMKTKKAGFDGLNINYNSVNKGLIDRLNKENLSCYTWTVNDPEKAAKVIEAGVAGITTDRPKWLRNQIQKKK